MWPTLVHDGAVVAVGLQPGKGDDGPSGFFTRPYDSGLEGSQKLGSSAALGFRSCGLETFPGVFLRGLGANTIGPRLRVTVPHVEKGGMEPNLGSFPPPGLLTASLNHPVDVDPETRVSPVPPDLALGSCVAYRWSLLTSNGVG